MTLGDFLKRECANGAEWNCSTLAADWCVALGYRDFAADWRGVIDPGLCDRVAADAGGLVHLWSLGIGDSLPVVSELLQAGDIAVVALGPVEAGAIFTGERWAIRAPRGLHFVAADALAVVKAWRPTHG